MTKSDVSSMVYMKGKADSSMVEKLDRCLRIAAHRRSDCDRAESGGSAAGQETGAVQSVSQGKITHSALM